jgi:hypothetical protein
VLSFNLIRPYNTTFLFICIYFSLILWELSFIKFDNHPIGMLPLNLTKPSFFIEFKEEC